MLKRIFKNKYFILYIALFLISFAVITITSECSFLYPTNAWVDSQCYLTVAKAMSQGKVLYKDIYEQKGPYLYFLHLLCYNLTPNSFLAVYFVEVLFAFASLCIIVQFLKLYNIVSVKKQIIICLFYALTVYFSISFAQGDSVEEFVNPLLLASVYFAFKNKHKVLNYFLIGLFAGVVFWVKFSLVGFFVSWYIFKLVFFIKDKNYKEMFYSIPLILLGLAISCIMPIVYFAMVDKVSTLFKVYILDNFIYYQSPYNIFLKFIFYILYIFRGIAGNPQHNILTIIALIVFIKLRQKYFKEMLFLILGFLISSFFMYIGGRCYRYYPFPLNIFSIFFYIVAVNEDFKINKHKYFLKISTAIVSLTCVLVMFFGGQAFYIFRPKTTLVQYKFAQIINQEEDATLLNYGFLDGGFYNFAKVSPNTKYFCTLNNKIPKIEEEHKKMMDNKEVDFIVIRADRVKNFSHPNYQEVARGEQRYHLTKTFTYILFKVKT